MSSMFISPFESDIETIFRSNDGELLMLGIRSACPFSRLLSLAFTSVELGVENERDEFIPRVGSNANIPLYDYVGGSQPPLN